MKKLLFLIPWFLTLFLTWCFNNNNPEVIDDCLIPEECTDNTSIDDLQDTYLTAFWTEPFWDIEISWWMATFSSPMYETDVVEPVTIRQEWENYYFSGEDLEWEFILKDCIDWWKWDMHYYTVWVAKIRDYYYEWCGDWIEWIKMSDEEYSQQREEFLTKHSWYIEACEKQIAWQIEENATDIYYGRYDYVNIWNQYKIEWYVSYSLNGEYNSKNTECTLIDWDYDVELDYYNAQWNITTKSDEELECLDSVSKYSQEQISKNPLITASLGCYDLYWEFFTWYVYATEYPDLWVRITTPAWWRSFEEDSIFNNKSDKPIFVRNWNRISYIQNWEEMEYLQVFEKSKNESLEEIITSKHLNEWCKLGKDIINYFHQNIIVVPGLWTEIYEPIWMSWGSREWCIPDDENKTGINDYRIPWYFESPDKTKYYKLVFTDWCAPGPCSMFGEVEVF